MKGADIGRGLDYSLLTSVSKDVHTHELRNIKNILILLSIRIVQYLT